MAKITSILLPDQVDNFIQEKLKSRVINELKKGEKSGFIKDFDRESFLNNLHHKYLK